MRSFSALAVLIGLSLAVSGCDRQSGENAQGAGNEAALSPDEVSPDEAAPSSGGETFSHVIDRSHKGETMPDKPFTSADGKPATLKVSTLQTWLDPENALGFHYGTGTLPTTILYDGAGKEVARIVGALEWDEEDGQKLIAEIGG